MRCDGVGLVFVIQERECRYGPGGGKGSTAHLPAVSTAGVGLLVYGVDPGRVEDAGGVPATHAGVPGGDRHGAHCACGPGRERVA